MNWVKFIPKFAIDHVPDGLPYCNTFDNSVLLVLDLSGYSAMTRRLVLEAEQRNHAGDGSGTESVSRLVRQCFEPILDAIDLYGGDLIKFVGDAVIAIWPNSIPDHYLRAQQCCVSAMQHVMALDTSLHVHGVLHSGPVQIWLVGDVPIDKRIETACLGETFNYAMGLLNNAKADEIIVTDAILQTQKLSLADGGKIIWQRQKEHCVMTIAQHFWQRRVSVWSPRRASSFALPAESSESRMNESLQECFIDASLPARNSWNEIRQATVLFVRLQTASNDVLHGYQLQEVFTAVLEVIRLQQGLLRQLTTDDKGTSLLILFGLPPASHENTAVPAVHAAYKISQVLKGLFITPVVGLASGSIYSGVIGRRRKEHALLGEALNLAARFMMLPAEEAAITMDKITFEKVKGLIDAEALLPLVIKGWNEPVRAYRLRSIGITKHEEQIQSLNQISSSSEALQIKNTLQLHDLEADRAWQLLLDHFLISSTNSSQTLVIEGVSGSGKTQTMQRMTDFLNGKPCLLCKIPNYEVQSSTPFHLLPSLLMFIRDVFMENMELKQLLENNSQMYNLNDECENVANMTAVRSLIYSNYFAIICKSLNIDLIMLRSVFNELSQQVEMTSGMDSTNTSRQNTDHMKRANSKAEVNGTAEALQIRVENAIVAILKPLSQLKPLILMLDDVQWLDSYSWRLVLSIVQQCNRVNVVLISRPEREYTDTVLQTYFVKTRTLSRVIQVSTISKSRIANILRHWIPNASVEQLERLAALVYTRSGANAIAVSILLQAVHLKLQSDHNLEQLLMDESQILPKDMNAVVIAQFDRLDATFQQLLKTASMFGQTFRLDDLQMFTGNEITCESLLASDRYQFLRDEGQGRICFRHCLVQAQIFCLMTEDERRPIHASIAKFLQQMAKSSSVRKTELTPIIYHHALKSGNEELQLQSGVKAISLFWRLGMATETIRIYRNVVQLVPFKTTLTSLKQAKVHGTACCALVCLNDFREACRMVPMIVQLLGLKMPSSSMGSFLYALKLLGYMVKYYQKGIVPPIHLAEDQVNATLNVIFPVYTRVFRALGEDTDRIGVYLSMTLLMACLVIVYQDLPFIKARSTGILGQNALLLGLMTQVKEARTAALSIGYRHLGSDLPVGHFAPIEFEPPQDDLTLETLRIERNELINDFWITCANAPGMVLISSFDHVAGLRYFEVAMNSALKYGLRGEFVKSLGLHPTCAIMAGSVRELENSMKYLGYVRRWEDEDPAVSFNRSEKVLCFAHVAIVFVELGQAPHTSKLGSNLVLLKTRSLHDAELDTPQANYIPEFHYIMSIVDKLVPPPKHVHAWRDPLMPINKSIVLYDSIYCACAAAMHASSLNDAPRACYYLRIIYQHLKVVQSSLRTMFMTCRFIEWTRIGLSWIVYNDLTNLDKQLSWTLFSSLSDILLMCSKSQNTPSQWKGWPIRVTAHYIYQTMYEMSIAKWQLANKTLQIALLLLPEDRLNAYQGAVLHEMAFHISKRTDPLPETSQKHYDIAYAFYARAKFQWTVKQLERCHIK